MNTNLQAFRQEIDNSPTLQAQVFPLLQKGDSGLEELIQLAETSGYHFTLADLQEALSSAAAGEELTDFELELVSGGYGQRPPPTGV